MMKSLAWICLTLLLPSFALAEGNIHIGQLRIHPFLSVTGTFSDNIFSAPSTTKKERDSFVTYTPGLQLQLPFRRHQAEAQYNAAITRYHTFETENTTDENASGLLSLKIGSSFGLRLSNTFQKGHEPRGVSSTGVIEEFRTNTATSSVTYQLANRSKIELRYGASVWKFFDSPYRDRDENFASSYFYYRFLPKTSAFVEVDHKQVSFQTSTALDNRAESVLTGLTWEITEKSRGTVKGGRLRKNYEDKYVPDFEGGWIGSLDLRHNFSDYASILLIGQRSVNEATVAGTRYFIATGASGECSFRIISKLAAVLRGAYGVDTFSDIAREDRTTMGGGGLRFSIRDWGEIGANYNVRERTSNIPNTDFTEHSYTVSVGMAL